MNTRAEAEARLARMPLKLAVTVADVGGARRSYSFGRVYVEIDATPTQRQLADLAQHLPIDDRDRAAALEEMRKP